MNYLRHDAVEDELTPFIHEFLGLPNLARIQILLTRQLGEVVDNQDVELVGWSQLLLEAAKTFAVQYKLVEPTQANIMKANYVFSKQMLPQNEARYYETAFWRRWCAQGIPDPNNIPLPLAPERTDFTTQTSDYMLSNPIGYTRFPTC